MVNSHLNWLRFAIMLKGKLRKTAEQSRRVEEKVSWQWEKTMGKLCRHLHIFNYAAHLHLNCAFYTLISANKGQQLAELQPKTHRAMHTMCVCVCVLLLVPFY